MQTGISFFKSKIARRFFLLFVVCAFLPLTIFVGYSYHRVENQLYEQSNLRMEEVCNSYGMALMDRLLHMTNLMQIYGSTPLGVQNAFDTANSLISQVTSMFTGLGLYQTGSDLKIIFGQLNLEIDVALFDKLLNQQGKPTLYTRKIDASQKAVYILVPFMEGGRRGLLIGQPLSSVLWGIGPDDILPSMTELIVYDEEREMIISTSSMFGLVLPTIPHQSQMKNYLHFEYNIGGETYQATGWALFLNSRFHSQTWTIVFSGTRSNILSAMLEFKRTFPLFIILALWSILFLSLFFIRRTLTPLAILQQGTERVGKKDFSSQLKINSGDEFEQLAVSFNAMTGQLNKQFNRLAFIDEINRSILSSLDSSVIIPQSLRMISEFFSSQLIILAQQKTGHPNQLHLTILEGSHGNQLTTEFVDLNNKELELFFCGKPLQVLSRDVFLPCFLAERQQDAFLFLPLDTDQYLMGALIMDYHDSPTQDSTENISQARQLADQLGVALANAKLVTDLERLSIGTVEALARTVDAKSKWTAGHSERVADMAVRVGRAMNQDKKQLELLFRGGLLHDIGKIGIPVAVLDKPGKLSDGEYNTIKTHPTLGEKILEPIEVYKDILPLVAQHHERFDGKGYPAGLSGEEIGVGARILCVVDVYDALISMRPYRDGWEKEKVLQFLRDNKGIMFDPHIVDTLLALDP